MFILQVYAQKPKEADEEDAARVGIRLRKKFSESSDVMAEEMRASIPEIGKVFQKKGISEFITTLTPGAQNAIYAASFAWGYENAARYVKSAMKLEEVKNAADASGKSAAVVESVHTQAQSEQPEVVKETSKFVWGFYNEDMKETQAQAMKSEHITEKLRTVQKEAVVTPMSAPEAVAMGIASGSPTPALLYCSGAGEVAEQAQDLQLTSEKKEELARLITLTPEHQRMQQEKAASKEKIAATEEAMKTAVQRKEEVVSEYVRAEKEMQDVIGKLDALSHDDKEELQKIASMLPKEISALVLRRDTLLARRKAMRAQLVKWVAFCCGSRESLASMPASRLLKLVSLSSLLKMGR